LKGGGYPQVEDKVYRC